MTSLLQFYGAAISLMLISCGHTQNMELGDVIISSKIVEEAVGELRTAFPSTGNASARWLLLDGGLGPATILHHRLRAESDAAYSKAQQAASRIQAGQSFATVAANLGQNPAPRMLQPAPFAIGALIAAKVATLEDNEWAGPIASVYGWEIVWLENRGGTIRSRSGVFLRRIRFPVGSQEDRALAEKLWRTLPLSAPPEWLATFPPEFRKGRLENQ